MELIDMPVAAKFIVAFVLVLVLIGAFALLWRRFAGGPLSTPGPGGRQPRLAVIDAATVDARRRLVLVRLDNTEHLLMIGGPTDILIKSNIASATANPAMREARPGAVAEIPARPAVDGHGWPQPFETMPRAVRPIEPPPYPRAPAGEGRDGLRPEPTPRLPREPMPVEPAAQTTKSRRAPVRLAPPSGHQSGYRSPVFQSTVTKRAKTVPPRPSQTDENNFAELAQRLEAASGRPIKPVEPAPVPRTAEPAEPVANAGARDAAYVDTPAPPVSAPAARAQEAAPASTGKT